MNTIIVHRSRTTDIELYPAAMLGEREHHLLRSFWIGAINSDLHHILGQAPLHLQQTAENAQAWFDRAREGLAAGWYGQNPPRSLLITFWSDLDGGGQELGWIEATNGRWGAPG